MTVNYFELLEVPVSYDIDQGLLKKQYLAKQRLYHPDRFSSGSESEKMKAVQRSADLNQGYQLLKSPVRRAEYLLSLHQVFVGSEQEAVKPSQALLMESMEQREALLEASGKQVVDDLLKEAQEAFVQTQNDFESVYPDHLSLAAEHAIRLRYLEKFQEEIKSNLKMLSLEGVTK